MIPKKVLITGSAGFVGRHFLKALEGHNITTVDIKDGMDVRRFFRRQVNETPYDLVIHLAAVVGGRATIENEPLSVAVDLSIDAEMFQWALRTKPKHLVYYSSSAAYPIHLQAQPGYRLRETDIDLDGGLIGKPDMTYGWAKLTGEFLAGFAEAEGIRTHVFRPFSGYGLDQDPSYPFRAFIDRAKWREQPFRIWGTGAQTRDWVHIDDVVKCTLAAVEADYPGPLNICTGRGMSFTELAKMVTKIAGYRPDFEYILDAPTGVQWRVGHPGEMFKVYTPHISLEEGIATALRK